MSVKEEASGFQEFIKQVFNAAADHFDHDLLPFWDIYGKASVDKLDLQPGMNVLDVCTGSGASAIPAAHKVGSEGKVTCVDLSDGLLELAKRKAHRQGLTNMEFHCADMTTLSWDSESFDAVIIVFGIFFIEDMEAALANLYRMLKPGGKMIVTTWQDVALEPVNLIWKEEVSKFLPELYVGQRPWDRVTHIPGFSQVFEDVGISKYQIEKHDAQMALNKPEDWWTIAMGTGFRGHIEQLSETNRKKFHDAFVDRLAKEQVKSFNLGVLYGIAQK